MLPGTGRRAPAFIALYDHLSGSEQHVWASNPIDGHKLPSHRH
jgi:hypothetical protein